jgi:WD40 repeat protein
LHASAQEQTRADVAQKAHTAVVMLRLLSNDVAGGLVVGSDPNSIYIASAAHLLPSCTQPFPDVFVTLDGVVSEKAATVNGCDSTAGVDTLLVTLKRDADLNDFLLRYDPNLLSSDALPPPEAPVHSVGDSNFIQWTVGTGETLLPSEGETLRFRSDVAEGQSGGGLFTEAWELIGTPLREDGTGIVTARPIQAVISTLRDKWSVPVTLKMRPVDQRVLGDDEVARSRAADLFGERAAQARSAGDVPGAITYVLEGREYDDTQKLRAEALAVPEPAMTLKYAAIPEGKFGYTAIASNDLTRTLAIAGADGSLRLIGLDDGRLKRNLTGLGAPIVSLAFSQDGTSLAGGISATPDHQAVGVSIWRTAGSSPPTWIPVQQTFGGSVIGLRIVDPSRIVGLEQNGTLFVMDTSAGVELWHQRKDVPGAKSLEELSPTEFLAGGDATNAMVTFTNDTFSAQALPGCPRSVLPFRRAIYGQVALTSSNPRVLVRACESRLILSDESGNAEHDGGSHQAWISQVVSLDGFDEIVSGGWDGEVRVWNAVNGHQLAQTGVHRGGIRQILAADSGKTIVTLEQDWQRFNDGGGVRVWAYHPENAVDYQEIVKPPANAPLRPPAGLPLKPAPQPRDSAVCWRSDGSVETLRPGNLSAEARVLTTPDCSFAAILTSDHVAMYQVPVGGGAWSKIGDAAADGLIRGQFARNAGVLFWTEETLQPGSPSPQTRAYVWAPPAAPVKLVDEPGITFGIGISDDGKLVALYLLNGGDGPVRIWDWRANKLILNRSHSTGAPADLVFGKDGGLFVSTGVGVEFWNQSGKANLLATTEFAQVAHIFLSADASTLAVVGRVLTDDGPRRLFLFDVAGRKLLSNSVLPRFPLDLTFAPNGEQMSVEYAQGRQIFGIRRTNDPGKQQILTGERLSADGLIVPSP